MNLQPANRTLYSNYTALSPDNKPMFRCDEKKVDYYIRNNLAEWVDGETIRLTFKPKGQGYAGDPFHLQDRKSECVACGANTDLTRHHIVPRMYRKHMPRNLISGDCHDILPLCNTCHSKYERKADKLKVEISKESGIPLHSGQDQEWTNNTYATKLASNIIKHGSKIPHESKKEMIWKIRSVIGHIPDYEKLVQMHDEFQSMPKYTDKENSHGKKLVEVMNEEDIFAFVIRWRKHFLNQVVPQFMPNHWDVERRYRDTNTRAAV